MVLWDFFCAKIFLSFFIVAVCFSLFLEVSDEKIGSHFRCSIVDLLQACYPALSEESITNEIVLSQNLDQILKALTCVEHSVGELFFVIVKTDKWI